MYKNYIELASSLIIRIFHGIQVNSSFRETMFLDLIFNLNEIKKSVPCLHDYPNTNQRDRINVNFL